MVGRGSSTSRRVRAAEERPLMRTLWRAATPSNQPQRRGRLAGAVASCTERHMLTVGAHGEMVEGGESEGERRREKGVATHAGAQGTARRAPGGASGAAEPGPPPPPKQKSTPPNPNLIT